MSNKRKPMMSDDELFLRCMEAFAEGPIFLGEKTYGLKMGEDPTAYKVRDFYENLITDGKLRVVEEVERVPYSSKNRNMHGEPFDTCSGCGEDLPNNFPNFCPGCGNKIKR